jgi:hypothetical protein
MISMAKTGNMRINMNKPGNNRGSKLVAALGVLEDLGEVLVAEKNIPILPGMKEVFLIFLNRYSEAAAEAEEARPNTAARIIMQNCNCH